MDIIHQPVFLFKAIFWKLDSASGFRQKGPTSDVQKVNNYINIPLSQN
jgi:hypothetical protein